MNKKAGIAHLFIQVGDCLRRKDLKTVCGRWQCGSPDAPARAAEFSSAFDSWSNENSVYGFCEARYGECWPVGRCQDSLNKTRSAGSEDESQSSSSKSHS